MRDDSLPSLQQREVGPKVYKSYSGNHPVERKSISRQDTLDNILATNRLKRGRHRQLLSCLGFIKKM